MDNLGVVRVIAVNDDDPLYSVESGAFAGFVASIQAGPEMPVMSSDSPPLQHHFERIINIRMII